MNCLAFLLLAGAAAAQEAAANEPRFVPLRLLVTATADVLEIDFPGAAWAVATSEVRQSPPGLRVRGLRLERLQGNRDRAAVDFLVYVETLPGHDLALALQKTEGGAVELEVRPVKGQGTPLKLQAAEAAGTTPLSLKVADLYQSDVPWMRLSKKRRFPRKVFAHYRAGWGNADGPGKKWRLWDATLPSHGAAHTPKIGWYDSLEPAVARAHLDAAKKAGLDGFLVFWSAMGDPTDRALDLLFKEAAKAGLEIVPVLEDAQNLADLETRLHYLVQSYGEQKAFARVTGLLALGFSTRLAARFPPEEFATLFRRMGTTGQSIFPLAEGLDPGLLPVFSGFVAGPPIDTAPAAARRGWLSGSLAAGLPGRLFAATVLPGYDDRQSRPPGRVVERAGGALYRQYWEVARSTDPDWIVIASFNEWRDGTEIEPSEELGVEYLRLTQELAHAWRKGVPPPPEPPRK
jgi:hypothetical protein